MTMSRWKFTGVWEVFPAVTYLKGQRWEWVRERRRRCKKHKQTTRWSISCPTNRFVVFILEYSWILEEECWGRRMRAKLWCWAPVCCCCESERAVGKWGSNWMKQLNRTNKSVVCLWVCVSVCVCVSLSSTWSQMFVDCDANVANLAIV